MQLRQWLYAERIVAGILCQTGQILRVPKKEWGTDKWEATVQNGQIEFKHGGQWFQQKWWPYTYSGPILFRTADIEALIAGKGTPIGDDDQEPDETAADASPEPTPDTIDPTLKSPNADVASSPQENNGVKETGKKRGGGGRSRGPYFETVRQYLRRQCRDGIGPEILDKRPSEIDTLVINHFESKGYKTLIKHQRTREKAYKEIIAEIRLKGWE